MFLPTWGTFFKKKDLMKIIFLLCIARGIDFVVTPLFLIYTTLSFSTDSTYFFFRLVVCLSLSTAKLSSRVVSDSFSVISWANKSVISLPLF